MTATPFDALRADVASLSISGSPSYDRARSAAIWNKRLDLARSPDAVIAVNSARQVAAVIRFARENGLKVSPRGSGHHYQAAALRDGGILLDLAGLDFIEIDAEARTARVGAGVRGGELSERLARENLAFPAGHCIDVGLSGYILGGGFGWNAGEWGAACTNVIAIELVTAAGEILLADAERHSDLFWAARGAGPGFFAVVTAYHLRLHPLPPATFTWRALFAVESAPALADWLSAATAAAHRSAEIGCFLLTHGDADDPTLILRISACGESEEQARERLASFASPPAAAPLRGEPKAELLPFTELPRLSPMPAGKRVAADHAWTDASVGEVLLAVHDIPSPSRHSNVDIVAFGGHAKVALPDHGALSVVGGTGVGVYALWDDPADDEANQAWVRRVDEAVAPLRTGRYVAEADLTAGPERLAECFTPEALARLRALRDRHDPDGVFFAWP